MYKRVIPLFVITFLITIAFPAQTFVIASGIEVGDEAPDFKLTNLDGESVKLSDYKGKHVMLNFWATWCPPCRVEMPDMQKFHEETDIAILAVNLTDTELAKSSVSSFINELGLTFPVLLDETAEVSRMYRINPIPTTFMVDAEGIIRFKTFGAMEYETMVEQYEKMEEQTGS